MKVADAGKARIRLNLTTKLDSALYDEPLTLSTKVPADWKSCSITQGQSKTTAAVHDGAVQYSVIPGAGEIILQP